MTITCNCGVRNDEEALFCRSCGAYLEWSRSPSEGAGATADNGMQHEAEVGASAGASAATGVHAPPREPGPEYQRPLVREEDEAPELPPIEGQLVCPKSDCRAANWPHVRFCRSCGTVLGTSAIAEPPSRLPGPLGSLRRRLAKGLRLEHDPLPAGERKRARDPILGKDPGVLLRGGLKVFAVLLILGAVLIGGLWAWTSTIHPQVVGFYASSREALFPRFRSVAPESIWYVAAGTCAAGVDARPGAENRKVTPTSGAIPTKFIPRRPRKGKGKKPCFPVTNTHSAAEAFDKDLDTFWLSPTKRGTNDRIVVRFQPPATISVFTIYAGDPTGAQVVPRNIQMTFYEPAQVVYYPPPVYYPPSGTKGAVTGTRRRLYWRVAAVREWTLQNTQAQQRFSTGDLENIARVVITIRGSYPTPNKKATQALTEVEFFDKY